MEIRASFCGERANDITETNVLNDVEESDGTDICPKRFKAHQEIKSIADVIKSLSERMDETSIFSICITRDQMLERGQNYGSDRKKSPPKEPLRASFIGEAGIDHGTLRKEFLTEMMTGIEKRFFEGGENGKTPKYSMTDTDKHNFKTLPPNFMEWCYNYISTGEMDPEVITERDVSELMELIKEIKAADHTTLMECTDRILLCGYTGAVSIVIAL